MTQEAFLQCLDRDVKQKCTLDDGRQLADLTATWTEAQRRKVSKSVAEKRRQPLDFHAYQSGYYHLLDLAVLAVGPYASARRMGSFFEFEPAALKILADRRPAWSDRWLAEKLKTERPAISWWLLRELLRAGVCTKPSSEDYVRFLVRLDGATEPWKGTVRVRRSDHLLKDPEFIDDLWQFFEVETSVFAWLLDKQNLPADSHNEDWATTMIRLSEAGRMDRDRLLSSALRALGADFSANALTGFVRFYEHLQPTVEEQVSAQPALLTLLSSRASHVVTFALEQLGVLQKAGRLDGAAFLATAAPVFALKPKAQPLAALAITGKLATIQPERIADAVNLAIEGLAHEASDVQAAATKLLEGWSARLHHDHASELRAKLPGLAATVRPRIQKLIDPLTVSGETEVAEVPADSPSWEQWKARAKDLPSEWRTLAGFDDALDAAESDALFGGVWFNIHYIPVLTSCAPIVPIDSVDELLDAVAHALEDLESADQLERILDAISRLCDQRTSDFEHRARPLAKRLLAENRDIGPGIMGTWMTPKLPQLLLRWLGEAGQVQFQQTGDPRGLSKFVERRLHEIEVRVAGRKPASLLSAPTHQHGWLDARVFVARLQTYHASPPPLADLIQALLRLAPDHLPEALKVAADLPGDWGAVVRYALGGPAPAAAESEDAFSMLLAAARARHSFGPLTGLATIAGAQRAPLLAATEFKWQAARERTNSLTWTPGGSVDVGLQIEPALPRTETNVLRPTLAICEESFNRWKDFGPLWCQFWMTAMWPANQDASLADGVCMLRERVNSPSSALDPNHLYLQPLLEPDRPWNELTWLALWIALVSKDAGSRGMAIDVLIAGIEDGRARLDCHVLPRLVQGPWLKLNRLVDVGREIARVSPRHAWWWAELLQYLLANLSHWPTDIHHVLALLLELLTDLQLDIPAELRDTVQSRTITGKGAKLQKSLLQLVASPGSAQRARAHDLALEATLLRAERWSTS